MNRMEEAKEFANSFYAFSKKNSHRRMARHIEAALTDAQEELTMLRNCVATMTPPPADWKSKL